MIELCKNRLAYLTSLRAQYEAKVCLPQYRQSGMGGKHVIAILAFYLTKSFNIHSYLYGTESYNRMLSALTFVQRLPNLILVQSIINCFAYLNECTSTWQWTPDNLNNQFIRKYAGQGTEEYFLVELRLSENWKKKKKKAKGNDYLC